MQVFHCDVSSAVSPSSVHVILMFCRSSVIVSLQDFWVFLVLFCHFLGTTTMLDVVFVCHQFGVHVLVIVAILGNKKMNMLRCENLSYCMYSARKLQAHECPYNIYSDGCSCGGSHGVSSATCLSLKKWVFSRSREESLCADPRALHYIFHQVKSLSH